MTKFPCQLVIVNHATQGGKFLSTLYATQEALDAAIAAWNPKGYQPFVALEVCDAKGNRWEVKRGAP